MLDFDLALLYEVETKVLNQSVKRNMKRFPSDFMFRLTPIEWEMMRSQIVTASYNPLNPGKGSIPVTQYKRNVNITPFAFTEQGVAMLSSVLNSEISIKMNISIMRAFVEIRRMVLENQLGIQLLEVKKLVDKHDIQLSELYEAIENIIDENAAKRKWDQRDRIGFKK